MVQPPPPDAGQTPISTYMMGALIITALSGILMLVDDFGGGYWYDYYNGIRGWVYLGVWNTWWGFLLIMPMALVMFYMAFWSSKAMRDPRVITVSQLKRFLYYSLGVFGFMLVLGIVWVAYAVSNEYDDWWLDTAFYGGAVGGLLASLIFYQAGKQAEALGYPR